MLDAAPAIGFPLLIKPSAGGGGKGMRLARSPGELAGAIAGARREAKAAFGDGTLLLERFVERPRHIEIQVFADTHGHTIHLGERECSLQRRHQKIIEEAPSPLLDEARRDAMGRAAAEAARSVGYVGAGTVEFIVPGDEPDEFFFMEMNTRLQVEHPVTELVTGLDLVEWQLRVAAGEPLPLRQEEIRLTGHAAEARIYAEDPARGFLPTGGTVLALGEPAGPHVRTDSGLAAGMTVTSAYDPMLAKIIAWAPDRDDGAAPPGWSAGRHGRARGHHQHRVPARPAQPPGRAGGPPRHRARGTPPRRAHRGRRARRGAGRRGPGRTTGQPAGRPGDRPMGRPGRLAPRRARLDQAAARVRAARDGRGPHPGATGPDRDGRDGAAGTGTPGRGDGPGRPSGVWSRGRPSRPRCPWTGPGRSRPAPHRARTGCWSPTPARPGATRCARDGSRAAGSGASRGGVIWLGAGGHTWMVREEEALAVRRDRAGSADGTVRSPMPGTVQAVPVTEGQPVTAGQPLVIVEAMKMEHTVTAPLDGTVSELLVKGGQQVAMDETLAVVRAAGPAAPDGGPAPDGPADPAAPDPPAPDEPSAP